MMHRNGSRLLLVSALLLGPWAAHAAAQPGEPAGGERAPQEQQADRSASPSATSGIFEPPLQETWRLGQPAPDAAGPRPDQSTVTLPEAVPSSEFVRIAVALGVVLGLLFLFWVAWRRVGGPLASAGRPSGVVSVVARYPIARGQYLVLLKLGRRIVLVHQTRQACATLSEVADPDEVAALLARVESGSRRSPTGLFHTLLGRVAADEQSSLADGQLADASGPEVVDLTRRSIRQRRSRVSRSR